MKWDSISIDIENESHSKKRAAHRQKSNDEDLHRRSKESPVIVFGCLGRRRYLTKSGSQRFLNAVKIYFGKGNGFKFFPRTIDASTLWDDQLQTKGVRGSEGEGWYFRNWRWGLNRQSLSISLLQRSRNVIMDLVRECGWEQWSGGSRPSQNMSFHFSINQIRELHQDQRLLRYNR